MDELPLEEKTGFNTVAGFVVTNIGHIPTAGNYFLWNGYRFEVVDMDGTRIDKYWSKNCRKQKRRMQRINKQNIKAPATGRGFNFIQTLFLKFKGCGTV